MKRWWQLAFGAVMLWSSLVPAGVAQAYTWPGTVAGRGQFYGYFENVRDSCGSYVMFNGVGYIRSNNTYTPGYGAAQFIAQIQEPLFDGSDYEDRTGAAFIVLTMLGVPGPATGGNHERGIDLARARWAEWVTAVNYYSSVPGKVEWARTMNFPYDGTSTYLNSLYQGRNGCNGTIPPDTRSPNDDTFYVDSGFQSRPTIVFHNNNGSTYMIKRNCANPIGDIQPLDRPDYSVALTADRNGSPYSVVAGKTYTLGAALTNAGPSNSETGVLQVQIPGVGVSQPCAPDCPLGPPAQEPLLFGYGGPGGFRNGTGIPSVAGRNWYWNVSPLCAGCTTSGRISFTVAPGATVGSTIHFDVYYYKGNLAGERRSASVEYKVVSERAPGVQANNGDIHAGGGICKQTQTDGFVKGFSGATSNAQYVVSASLANGINGFKSNGTGADSLRVGQNGAYAQICRPDLLATANAYYNTGTGYNTIPGNDFDVTGKSGIYFYNGAALTIHGIISNKLTVVARSGKVVVSGPITINNANYAARNVPSLGIIASNNIEIQAGVTRVDAYLFSNAVIDTCTEASLACATPQLLINGFVMAKDIAFHRLGPANTNGTPITELVVLNPQIYLNPPRLFDASVDEVLLEGQGERQPLF